MTMASDNQFGFEIGKLYYSPQNVVAFYSCHPRVKTITVRQDVPYVLTDVIDEDGWIKFCILHKKYAVEEEGIAEYIRRFQQ